MEELIAVMEKMLKKLDGIDRKLKATNEKLDSINNEIGSMQSDIGQFCERNNVYGIEDVYNELSEIGLEVNSIKLAVEDY